MQVDGKVCLFEIIIGYYIYTMLFDASACKKRTPKGFNKRLMNCPLNLVVIRGRIILKRERNIDANFVIT